MRLLKTAFITPAIPRRAPSRARPQGAGRLRRTLRGTSQGDARVRTPLEDVFNSRVLHLLDAQNGHPIAARPQRSRLFKTASSKAAGSTATEAYPQGTSQGGGRLRTPLEGVFNSLNYELYEV